MRQANATRERPVVLIHGLWLLPSILGELGRAYSSRSATRPLTPDWPDEPKR